LPAVAAAVVEVAVVQVAQAFLAVEAVFREEAAISREVKEAFHEAAAVSLAAPILLIAEAFLAAEAVSPEAQTIFQVAEAGLFRGAAMPGLVETVPGLLDIIA
jgi:hypothetical protein